MRMRHAIFIASAMAVAGCSDNSQSVLIPAGLEARQIAGLTWVLFLFGAFVFLIVMGAVAAAVHGATPVRNALAARKTIIGLGLVFPATTLLALFIYSALS